MARRHQYFMRVDDAAPERIRRLCERLRVAPDALAGGPGPGAGRPAYRWFHAEARAVCGCRHDADAAMTEAGADGPEHRVSADVPLVPADDAGRRHAPPPASAAVTRPRVEALIGARALRRFAAGGNRVVNVVISDDGFDPAYLASLAPTARFERIGSAPYADSARRALGRPHGRHANMVGRNVLSLAPFARLWDMAVLPDRILDADAFASAMTAAFDELLERIMAAPDESWVVTGAWGLRSRDYEGPSQRYSDDRAHLLSRRIAAVVGAGADMVFSAGNNGAFAATPGAGPGDVGPYRSIFGANGLPETLTVGAVTAQGDWIGWSSQGPEPAGLRRDAGDPARKPDICAPSWFCEADDRRAISAGTSGACALTAGAVAAVRRRLGAEDLPPAALIDLIRRTARPLGHRGGDGRATPVSWRHGSGVLDGAALAAALERDGPEPPESACA